MEITFTINDDLYRRFAAACILSGKDQNAVICKKIEEFASSTIANEVSGLTAPMQKAEQSFDTRSKVLTRIPLWAKRPEQHNHKILQAFFATESEGMTTRERMREFFIQADSGTGWQFDNNFASMRTNEGNSHGRVFACFNDIVTLTEEASGIAYKYRDQFLADIDPMVLEQHQGKNAVSVQRNLFISWFKEQLYRGRPYNPVTISGYAGRIESACYDPAFEAIKPKNLFEVLDYREFMEIRKQIMACPGFEAFDAKSHRGFTAALNKYADFLLRDHP